jgi:hypothetical protein
MSTRWIMALCILLALLGWVGLGAFTYHNAPDALNRWVALAILWPTLAVTFLPAAYAIHLRRRNDAEVGLRAGRQSAFVATFLTLCTWLRMVEALNWANALLMASLFIATEALLSARAK